MSDIDEISFPEHGGTLWAGMRHIRLISPDRNHNVLLEYVGEPPHGDSFHRISIDGRPFPGYAWGNMFAFTSDSRYLGFSWMAHLYERRTVIVDVVECRYFELPEYIYNLRFASPHILNSNEDCEWEHYSITGDETWVSYG